MILRGSVPAYAGTQLYSSETPTNPGRTGRLAAVGKIRTATVFVGEARSGRVCGLKESRRATAGEAHALNQTNATAIMVQAPTVSSG